MDLVKELDEIMREMIWLIRSQRPSANKTLFGKVYRALQQAKGVRLTEKNRHSCDQYTLEKVSEFQYRVYEHCQKHRPPDLLAKIDWNHKNIHFVFEGQNYSDVLGLAAALVAPTIECVVQKGESEKLNNMSCTGFRITRSDQVVRFETITYRKEKDPLMYLKGEVLKNLLPYSDLIISVPLAGKVKILEKKKTPDVDEITPEAKEKLKAKTPAKDQPMVPPIDPRIIPPVSPKMPKHPQIPKAPREDSSDLQQSPLDQNPPSVVPNAVDPNNEMNKNSDPDMIQIQDPNYIR